jgi:hypothetical protein
MGAALQASMTAGRTIPAGRSRRRNADVRLWGWRETDASARLPSWLDGGVLALWNQVLAP